VNLRHRIRGFHVGQLVIVVFVGALAAALLLSARRKAVGDKGLYEWVSGRLQERIDSLYGNGYLRRRLRRLNEPRDTSDPLTQVLDPLDEQHDLESIPLVSEYRRNAAGRDKAAVRVGLLDAAMVVVFGVPLWILWVWFDGRQRAP